MLLFNISQIFKNLNGYKTSNKYKKSNEYFCPILNASKRKIYINKYLIDHVTSQVLKIIMILDTWLDLANNENCRLVTNT